MYELTALVLVPEIDETKANALAIAYYKDI
jgi:hypothetical protein